MTEAAEAGVLAADIGGSRWRLATRGGARRTSIIATGSTSDDPKDTIDSMRSAYVASENAASLRHLTMGLSFAGGVDAQGVVSAWPNRPSWLGFPLAKELNKSLWSLDISAIIDDGRAAAIGEHLEGAARDWPDFLCLSLGTGLGGGFIMNGDFLQSQFQDGKTIGHWRALSNNAKLCQCGDSFRCLQMALHMLPPKLDSDVLRQWESGIEMVEVISDVSKTFNIRRVLLTGGRLRSPVLARFLTAHFENGGMEVRVSGDVGMSSLLGAIAILRRAPL